MTFNLQDIQTIETDEDASPFEQAVALQRAINSGMWSLQGSYGRSMMDAIMRGDCLLGRNDCRDYYGNHIPSRDQVKAGTKGSFDFVVKHKGKDWADKMVQI
jgi:hypothetical protein